MSVIAVTIDPDTGISEREAVAACAAVDAQAREFAGAWGCDYTPVQLYSPDVLLKLEGRDLDDFIADARLLTVSNDIGVPGAIGAHFDEAGVIFARVQNGPDWTVTLSHEVLEEMGDPTVDKYADRGDGTSQAVEACDRVEGDVYEIDGVRVSNYLLPAAFQPGSKGPWDKLGRLSSWDGMTDQGYYIRRSADGSTTDVFARTIRGSQLAMTKMATKPTSRLWLRGVGRIITVGNGRKASRSSR